MPFNTTAALSPTHKKAAKPNFITVECNETLRNLLGPSDNNIGPIEQKLDVKFFSHGNQIHFQGHPDNVDKALKTIEKILPLAQERPITPLEIHNVIDNGELPLDVQNDISSEINIKGKKIIARTPGQADYLKNLATKRNVFGVGEAGTGKTYLAVAKAVSTLLDGEVDRIYLCRPAVEAGERLGFLPGDLEEKVDPYMRPLYDALYDLLPPEKKDEKIADQVKKWKDDGKLEVAPLALMRGRNLKNAFIILDEAQNATFEQMVMFLTRQQNSYVVVQGDITQCDLPKGTPSGLAEILQAIEGNDKFGITRFTEADIVRDPMVKEVINEVASYRARRDAEAKANTAPAANAGAPSPNA